MLPQLCHETNSLSSFHRMKNVDQETVNTQQAALLVFVNSILEIQILKLHFLCSHAFWFGFIWPMFLKIP